MPDMDKNLKLRAINLILPLIVPMYAVKYAWWMTGIIVIVGALISYFSGDWTIFSRSGSLIVVCALGLAFIDYTMAVKKFVKQMNKQLRDFYGDKYEEIKLKMRERVSDDLKKYKVKKSDKEIAYISDVEWSSYWENFPNRIGGVWKMHSVKTEISLAIIGTLIWGFGDLFG